MKPKKLTCESPDCKKVFTPRVRTQRFCSPQCKNLEAQRRYLGRQKAEKAATA